MNINKRLLQYVKTMYIYVVVVGILSLLAAVCIILQAHFIATLINGAFLLKQSLPLLQTTLFMLLAVLVVRASLIWGGELVTNVVSITVKSDLRNRLYSHLFKLGPLYMKRERSGEIVNTANDGVEALDAYFNQFFPQVTATLVIPLVILVVVFKIDLLSGIVLFVTWPILPVFMVLIGLQANVMTRKRWCLMSQLSAHFLDVLQGLTTLKLFGRSEAQEETIRKMSERYGNVTMKVLRVAFLSSFVMEMGATLSTAIIAVEIGLRLLYNGIPFESAFFVLLLAPEFYLPLRSLGTQFHASMDSAASAERIFDMIEMPLQVRHVNAKARLSQMAVQHSLAFQDVHYTYPAANEEHCNVEALKGVSFKILPGQKVAFVGRSGAGKTTIASLLLRFMDPAQGEITIDGQSTLDFPAEEWRKMITWQPQNPYVFNTTVGENIRMGRADATLEEIKEAARSANIHDFILTLPQGYETIIGERGARLSGGQVQRLSLARAILKDAPILILDEATSTLDIESEQQVLRAIDTVMKDRILLVIAHRLNSICDADQIIVLQGGHAVASGTHQELLSRSPEYQNLVNAFEEKEVMV